MKNTAILFSLLFCMSLVQSQTSNALGSSEFSDDVRFLKENFDSQGVQSCYKMFVGEIEQGDNGFREVDVMELRKALAEGPTVSATGTCKGVSSVESINLIIVYNDGTEMEYPVSRLAEIKGMPSVGERLLHNAKEVRFQEISVKDTDGVVHEVPNQVFHILS